MHLFTYAALGLIQSVTGDEVGNGDAEGDADEDENGFNAALQRAEERGERQIADIDQGEEQAV